MHVLAEEKGTYVCVSAGCVSTTRACLGVPRVVLTYPVLLHVKYNSLLVFTILPSRTVHTHPHCAYKGGACKKCSQLWRKL